MTMVKPPSTLDASIIPPPDDPADVKRDNLWYELMKRSENSVYTMLNFATALQRTGANELVRHFVREIMAKDKNFLPAMLMQIAILVEDGNAKGLYALGHRLVKFFPDHHMSWFAVSGYYLCAGKWEATRKHLQKTIGLRNDFGEAYVMLGHCFTIENERDRAIEAYSKAGRLNGTKFYSEYFIGLLYLQLESLALAEAHFTEAMNANPDKGEAFLQLGRIYLFRPAENAKERVANALRAEEYLKKAVACLVQADDLGARFNVNRMRDESTAYKTGFLVPPNHPNLSFQSLSDAVNYHLGLCYLRLKNFPDCHHAFINVSNRFTEFNSHHILTWLYTYDRNFPLAASHASKATTNLANLGVGVGLDNRNVTANKHTRIRLDELKHLDSLEKLITEYSVVEEIDEKRFLAELRVLLPKFEKDGVFAEKENYIRADLLGDEEFLSFEV